MTLCRNRRTVTEKVIKEEVPAAINCGRGGEYRAIEPVLVVAVVVYVEVTSSTCPSTALSAVGKSRCRAFADHRRLKKAFSEGLWA